MMMGAIHKKSSREGPLACQRIRLRFGRDHRAIHMSHLQQIEMMRTALKASSLPLTLTGAKKQKPKISFGPAISVGHESIAEYCDVDLSARVALKEVLGEISPHLVPGYFVVAARSIPRFFPSIEASANVVVFRVCSPLLIETRRSWEEFDCHEEFVVLKKKTDRVVEIDAKRCVRSWTLDNDNLDLDVRFGPGRTLKPERIIQSVCHFSDEDVRLGEIPSAFKINRRGLYLEKENGELIEV